ncbi:hypothetical protein RF11_16155 [Thelohanellus kitauei]|uniref:Uncharacterized protein n=1 Tax=Thelohanellus kitauei TaxID=669202 RepID=A0A0C2IIH8_THEKT|nr:hypothetical protein RF11_16155 [Thelohanellus kitauei]
MGYLLTRVDQLSRSPEAVPIPNISIQSGARATALKEDLGTSPSEPVYGNPCLYLVISGLIPQKLIFPYHKELTMYFYDEKHMTRPYKDRFRKERVSLGMIKPTYIDNSVLKKETESVRRCGHQQISNLSKSMLLGGGK